MCAIFCNFGIVLVALRGVGRLLGAGPGFVQTLIFVLFFRRLRTGGLPCTTGSWPTITRPRRSGPTSPASWRLPRVRPFFFLTFFFFDFIRLTTSFAGLQLLPPGSRNWRRTFGPPVLNAPRVRRRSRPQLSRRGRLRGELVRLRRLEANHLVELEAAKRVGREEVESLKKRLEEVDQQRLKLRDEVTSKSNELSATAKRWVSEISALDRGLAGESLHLSLSFPLPAFGCRLPA